MGNDKVLVRLKKQILDLQPLLQAFENESVQPTAGDCDKLQQHLCSIQESLSIFKYQKQNQEVSPNFNLHARVSEELAPETVKKEKLPTPELLIGELKSENKFSPIENSTASKLPAAIVIGINDKFRFINELFSQNPAEYNIVMEQLSSLQNWPESELYLGSLKSLYAWKDNQDVVKHFYSLIKRRFE